MTTGYLTQNDIVNFLLMSNRKELDSSRIKELIESDIASEFKTEMQQSVNYYNVKHDILSAKRQYLRDGVWVDNKGKANNKQPHPFHRVLVNEKATYIAGNPLTIGIAGEARGEKKAAEYRAELLNIMTEKFDDVVYDWVSNASKKGVEWVHFYINPEGDLKYVIVPAEQCIPVYDTQYEDRLIGMIRFYAYDLISGDKVQKRYKVEHWTDENVMYWVQEEDGSFIADSAYKFNPSAHWYSFSTADASATKEHSWGRVPFVGLWNNTDGHTDLRPIKTLIDSYDKVKCGWANDLEDFTEVLYVIKGLQALSQEATAGLTELAAITKNIKEDGAIAVETDGAVQTIRAEIPVEAKEKFLDIVGREIVYFGEGADVSADILSKSHAPSGVALQFLYARLDMKANRMIRKLRGALKEFVWFVTEYINRVKSKSFDSNTVTFTVNKAQIFNETERVQLLVSSNEMLSLETRLENHPLVDDVQSEIERLRSQANDPVLSAVKPEQIPDDEQ